MHCGVITTVKLINISITPHGYLCVCVFVVITVKIYRLSKWKGRRQDY